MLSEVTQRTASKEHFVLSNWSSLVKLNEVICAQCYTGVDRVDFSRIYVNDDNFFAHIFLSTWCFLYWHKCTCHCRKKSPEKIFISCQPFGSDYPKIYFHMTLRFWQHCAWAFILDGAMLQNWRTAKNSLPAVDKKCAFSAYFFCGRQELSAWKKLHGRVNIPSQFVHGR